MLSVEAILRDGEEATFKMSRTGDKVSLILVGVEPNPSSKPGPKPGTIVGGKKVDATAVIEVLRRARRAMGIKEIKQELSQKYPEASDNLLSWAIVDSQFEGCMRGKGRPLTGPVMKKNDLYMLRK